MPFTGEAAVVTGVGQKFRDQNFVGREPRVPVSVHLCGGRIATGEKTRSAWSADRGLTVGICECDPVAHKAVEIGRANVGVSKRRYGVVPLSVGTVPENIRTRIVCHGICDDL